MTSSAPDIRIAIAKVIKKAEATALPKNRLGRCRLGHPDTAMSDAEEKKEIEPALLTLLEGPTTSV